jgi:hypothetical protein
MDEFYAIERAYRRAHPSCAIAYKTLHTIA